MTPGMVRSVAEKKTNGNEKANSTYCFSCDNSHRRVFAEIQWIHIISSWFLLNKLFLLITRFDVSIYNKHIDDFGCELTLIHDNFANFGSSTKNVLTVMYFPFSSVCWIANGNGQDSQCRWYRIYINIYWIYIINKNKLNFFQNNSLF